MDDFDAFVNSDFYNNAVLEIKKKAHEHNYEVYVYIVPDVDESDKKECLEFIKKYKLTLYEIKYFLEKDFEKIINFIEWRIIMNKGGKYNKYFLINFILQYIDSKYFDYQLTKN